MHPGADAARRWRRCARGPAGASRCSRPARSAPRHLVGGDRLAVAGAADDDAEAARLARHPGRGPQHERRVVVLRVEGGRPVVDRLVAELGRRATRAVLRSKPAWSEPRWTRMCSQSRRMPPARVTGARCSGWTAAPAAGWRPRRRRRRACLARAADVAGAARAGRRGARRSPSTSRSGCRSGAPAPLRRAGPAGGCAGAAPRRCSPPRRAAVLADPTTPRRGRASPPCPQGRRVRRAGPRRRRGAGAAGPRRARPRGRVHPEVALRAMHRPVLPRKKSAAGRAAAPARPRGRARARLPPDARPGRRPTTRSTPRPRRGPAVAGAARGAAEVLGGELDATGTPMRIAGVTGPQSKCGPSVRVRLSS